MKRHAAIFLSVTLALAAGSSAAEPLRVFIRGGQANRGDKVHAHPRFLAEWKTLLAQRGMKVDGATDWPTAEQAKNADVIVAYAQEGGDATPEQERMINEFVKRGGGLVVIHTAAVSKKNPAWWKGIIGGAWVPEKTKWKEGPMDLYYVENQRLDGGHPITKGASNFHLDDEIYYDMDITAEARVLATSYTPNVPSGRKSAEGGRVNIHDIQPQMWAYERTAEGGAQPYRAFVSIPGHLFATFEMPHYRAILLRGIAWAGKRANLDEFCKPEEISSLTYPEGGPQKPEKTLANLEIHPDFTMKLVAAEPLINKPMNFDWDPAGRLWVAETPEYPNGRRGMRPDYRGKEWKDHGGIDPTPGVQERKAIDKISILSDSNGDGVMDKKEIFFEGLDLVTGLVFHKDGVIVTQAPEILWLRDTNADGKADKVEKLYSGLGIGDTHAVINNPRWGWDGWIYATHGYSASNRVLNAKGETQGAIGSGVVRFLPDGSKIEQYSSKGGNTWGLQITADNRVMWTQPTSGQLLMHTVLPEYALARGKIGNTQSYKVVEPSGKAFPLIKSEDLPYVQIDWVGSFTASAGTVIYDGGAWPDEYNGDYFSTEPTINLIHHTRLTLEGSSYKATKLPGREETEFIRSKDLWWRPIEVRVGPEGAMYVADFYNQAVIHNDTRGPDHNRVNAAVRPDRDHYFGRIWKIEHKQTKKLAVPDLSKADGSALVEALDHPSRHVRMNASRLLVERFGGESATKDSKDARSALGILEMRIGGAFNKSAEARMAALWTLGRIYPLLLPNAGIQAVLADEEPLIKRTALKLVASGAGGVSNALKDGRQGLTPHDISLILRATEHQDPNVRLDALLALAARPDIFEQTPNASINTTAPAAIVKAWPKFDDDFQRSAAVGALLRDPAGSIAAALESGDSSLAPLVATLTQAVGEKNDTAAAAKLVTALAAKPASADALKRGILDTLGKSLKQSPAMSPELSKALAQLLGSGASGSALPLAAKWDTAGALKGEIARLTTGMIATLNDPAGSDEARFAAATSLLGLRSANPAALPAVTRLLASNGASPTLQKWIVVGLGETNDPAAGSALIGAFSKLAPDVQTAAFDVLLKRADTALALLDAMAGKTVDVSAIGPANLARLRTHADKNVAQRAGGVLDQILGPAMKAKNEAIAKLTPVVEQPGNVANGKQLFTTACAVCHKLGELGADIGPGLTGMGTHGPVELLTAIVDPNREVDPTFATSNFETKDGQLYSGVIASENPASITIKSLAGVQEVKVANIKTRVNTGRSLMPEGFEALGGEAMRDVIAFMQAESGGHFRTLDLSRAFTANTARGLYISEANARDTLKFAKTGHVTVEGVPFNIVAPDRAPANVIVLKGGQERSFAKSMPERVEVPVGGFKANRLHFLGGIAGWGHPFGGDGEVVMRVTAHTSDGQREGFNLKNGVEFADYIREVDVPGSKLTKGLVKENQLRWFTLQLSRSAPIDRLTLESLNTGVAPTTVAITAELADPNAPPRAAGSPATSVPSGGAAPAVAAPATGAKAAESAAGGTSLLPPATAKGVRALAVGGGSSHDFRKWFGDADKKILSALGPAWYEYTEDTGAIAKAAPNLEVLYLSANQPLASESRKAIFDMANAGKGLLLVHPALWYNWNNFPEYNRDLVGGGSKSHDKFGEFEVEVLDPDHPITVGLPKKFKITDELYYFVPDASGAKIQVLAQATSPQTGKTYPQVWITRHPKARIACITLGHDGKAHESAEFQTLLRNAFKWASGK